MRQSGDRNVTRFCFWPQLEKAIDDSTGDVLVAAEWDMERACPFWMLRAAS